MLACLRDGAREFADVSARPEGKPLAYRVHAGFGDTCRLRMTQRGTGMGLREFGSAGEPEHTSSHFVYCVFRWTDDTRDMYWINEILREFDIGIASAKAGEVAAIDVYDSALSFACNSLGMSKRYVDEVLSAHFDANGYPASW